MEKTGIFERTDGVAKRYDIEKTKVKLIIKEFSRYCIHRLSYGEVVEIRGLVTFKPDNIFYRSTTIAYKCMGVSKMTGISYYTVYSVVREYIDSLIGDLTNGNPVEIRGMVSLSPMMYDGEFTGRVYARISPVIKSKLIPDVTGVSGVRVSTHKLLKRRLSYDTANT